MDLWFTCSEPFDNEGGDIQVIRPPFLIDIDMADDPVTRNGEVYQNVQLSKTQSRSSIEDQVFLMSAEVPVYLADFYSDKLMYNLRMAITHAILNNHRDCMVDTSQLHHRTLSESRVKYASLCEQMQEHIAASPDADRRELMRTFDMHHENQIMVSAAITEVLQQDPVEGDAERLRILNEEIAEIRDRKRAESKAAS